ncbi:MAG: hypothetical protein HY684_07135 [Chloroflexi bacterium]|nr:hypothetical protein [Chloroflexota bacterium]
MSKVDGGSGFRAVSTPPYLGCSAGLVDGCAAAWVEEGVGVDAGLGVGAGAGGLT